MMAASASIAMDDEDMPAASEGVALATRRRVIVYGMNFAPEMAGVGRYTGEIAEHRNH